MLSRFGCLALCLAACGPTSFYGFELPAELAEYGEELDQGFEALADELQRARVTGDAAGIISNARPLVSVAAAPIDGYDGQAAWWFRASLVFVWKPGRCLASTAFLHEVTHLVLCSVQGGDCDLKHRNAVAWQAVEAAGVRWRVQSCR